MIGDLINAFAGAPKYTPQYSSDPLHKYTDDLTNTAAINLHNSGNYLNAYEDALKGQSGNINDALSRYTDLAKNIQGRNNNPLDEYKNLGDYLFSKADSNAVDPVINNLSNRVALHNRVMGVNPGADSTYDRLMRAGVASKVRLSALSDIINQLGPTSNSLNNQRLQNDQFALGLTPQEIAMRNGLAGQQLLPLFARTQALNDMTGLGQGISGLNKSNIYGYRQDDDKLRQIGNAFNALKDGAWEGLSFYQNLMGGGMGGGGGGRGGGMGGGGGQGGGMGGMMGMFGGMGGGGQGGGGYGGGYQGGMPQSQWNQGAQMLNGYQANPYYNYGYAPMGGYGAM